MNVAVLGSGGREHALVKALKQSPLVKNIICIPGSDGIALDAECFKLSLDLTEKLIEVLKSKNVQFVVVGPEDPLVKGLSDDLRKEGFKVFGPGKEGAKLEGSKIYSKDFMKLASIPTAGFAIAKSYDQALNSIKNFKFPLVVKADVLAAGKGVTICQNQKDFEFALKQIFIDKIFGPSEVLIEEFLSGWELSYICITDGESYEVCPLVQDHKTLKDKGQGPNTGGMGVFGPITLDQDLRTKINSRIVEPTLKQLKKMNIKFQGALFIGLMIQDNEPYVLEYNVRFGDPETQIILPLIDGDVFEILFSAVQGPLKKIKVKNQFGACVVLAAEGYPEKPVKDSLITFKDLNQKTDQYFIFSGAVKKESDFYVAGGRVLGAVGLGASKSEALEKAYVQASKASWKGLQKRSDIGTYFNSK